MGLVSAVSFIVVVTMNVLANALPIAGITTGEVSDSYFNLFAPAGLTFAIWGLIYFLLAGFSIYSAFPRLLGEERHSEMVRRTAIWFTASNIFNSLWIFAWHYQQIGLSLILIILVFLTVGVVYHAVRAYPTSSTLERVFIKIPFQIYFGWLTVAVIANVTTWLVDRGWDGFGLPAAFWTVLVIVVAVGIGYLVLARNFDLPYIGVLVWALLGIVIKRVQTDPQVWSVIITAALAIVALVVLAVLEWRKHEERPAAA